ncbi:MULTISPECIES: hypothetical protein [Streptomyces]|uniref:Uncharacterized protein n=1 Tax=Streptomyces changanensis TaxID=2964669 RepID=A0ABY5NC66_9ACTN|nr:MULTISPECIES: hypothetical protein [Streptomyces]UUS33594.1 hypothetical protein NRO40_24050 [Streptomyces changanensis]
MTTHPQIADSPIYDRLVEEHGDVLDEVRRLAETAHEQAERMLDWDALDLPREPEQS